MNQFALPRKCRALYRMNQKIKPYIIVNRIHEIKYMFAFFLGYSTRRNLCLGSPRNGIMRPRRHNEARYRKFVVATQKRLCTVTSLPYGTHDARLPKRHAECSDHESSPRCPTL